MNLLSTERTTNANVNVVFRGNYTSMLFNRHLLAHGIRIHDCYAFVASTEVKEPIHAPETQRCFAYVTSAAPTETRAMAYVATRTAEPAPTIVTAFGH